MNNLYKANYDYIENRGVNTPPKNKNKLCFSVMKNNTIKSLNEVEYFLNNINSFWKYIKLYKILK